MKNNRYETVGGPYREGAQDIDFVEILKKLPFKRKEKAFFIGKPVKFKLYHYALFMKKKIFFWVKIHLSSRQLNDLNDTFCAIDEKRMQRKNAQLLKEAKKYVSNISLSEND